MNVWAPEMETFLRDDKFVVRMDIPGVTKDDVNVEVNDDSLVIHGERQQVHEEDRDGYYRSERSYGRFYRDVPLPEGAQPETAHASYRDGVLEVSITVPPRQVTRPRRVEISGASTGTEGTSPLIKDRTTSVSTERAVAHDREPWTPNTR